MDGSNILYLPYRKTEQFDIVAALRDVITNEFYQSASLFEKELQSLKALRAKVIAVLDAVHASNELIADLDSSSTLLELYYCQLCYIQRKFPQDCLEFTWYSNHLTYQAHHKVSLRSFEFEKVNILYNLGALYSQAGFLQDRSDLDGLKKASLYFQRSAGFFHELTKAIPAITQFKIPIDYSTEVMAAFEQLMLAQAQEAYWQRAVASNGSDKIVSILSQQVGLFYKKSHESFNKSEFILRAEFLNHIRCKSLHFLAAAQYRIAQHEYAQGHYGDQVAHLVEADLLCSQALKSSTRGMGEPVMDDLRGLDAMIKSVRRSLEKENDLIYHQDVPSGAADRIAGRPMVQPLVPDHLLTPVKSLQAQYRARPLFENLLPYIVIQSAQAFKERQEQFVQANLVAPVKNLTKLLESFIAERNLPLALDSKTKLASFPDSLKQQCQDLYANDALTKLQRSQVELASLLIESKRLIDGCRERILHELLEEHEFRSRQGSLRWKRVSSAEAALPLVQKIQHYEQYLAQAADGDRVVRANILEIKPYLEMMSLLAIPGTDGKARLKKFVPDTTQEQFPPEVSKVMHQLKDALNEAALQIQKRHSFVEAVELKNRESSVLPKIISEYRLVQGNEDVVLDEATFEPVFSKHMKNFDADLHNLYQIRDAQADLEHKIDLLNSKFEAVLSTPSAVQTARREALQTLTDAYNGYKENYENLSEGLKFYKNFIENVQPLLKECDDFVYARRVEGRELESRLNAPSTPSKPKAAPIQPPSSVSTQRYKTQFSDDDDDTFYSDADDSFGGKSPLKQKRGNDGHHLVTKEQESTPPRTRKKEDAFWDPKHGIQFE